MLRIVGERKQPHLFKSLPYTRRYRAVSDIYMSVGKYTPYSSYVLLV